MIKLNNFLFTINVRWWNAEAAYAINVARSFKEQGYRVWVLVNQDSPAHHKAVQHGIPVLTDVNLDSNSPIAQFSNCLKLLSFIDQQEIQLINSFKSNGSFLFSLIRKLRPHLTYIKTRGEARPPKANKINARLYGPAGCDGIITVGKIVEKWVTNLPMAHQQIKTIYYGDSPTVTQNSAQISTYQTYGLTEKDKIIALVGRTQQVKGHRVLLQALATLQDPEIKLLFLIKDLEEFPDELQQIKELIQENQLENQVKILGFQKDLGNILQLVQLGVIPSLGSEVNCRVAVEFFSLGIPVLSFPTGTLPDIIQHQINGYLCREKTAEELVLGLKYMFASKDKRQASQKAALAAYQNKYSLTQFFEETLAFFQQCRRPV